MRREIGGLLEGDDADGDVTFAVEGGEAKAHRAILAARSAFFKGLFGEAETLEVGGKLEVEGGVEVTRLRAEEDGDEWIVNGQKVWTSLAKDADLGMLIVRSAPDLPKHKGITYFAIDMHQPGVEVRPLREMTGHAMFNETFLTDARVASSAIIGEFKKLGLGLRTVNRPSRMVSPDAYDAGGVAGAEGGAHHAN